MLKLESYKRKYFGTDGVRDIAFQGNMTQAFAYALGMSYAKWNKSTDHDSLPIAIGMDTRISGEVLAKSLAQGIVAAGGKVVFLGVLPTPGVSFVLKNGKFAGGAMVSASHNPWQYNGIKFFHVDGFKLSDKDEFEIEEIFDKVYDKNLVVNTDEVIWQDGTKLGQLYLDKLVSTFGAVKGYNKKLVVDASNGAASAFVKPLFSHWDGEVIFLANSPDGKNINENVGVMHLDNLKAVVLKEHADLGIAFDGDTDRVLMCDAKGRTIDGDIMMLVVSRYLAATNKLGAGLVATIMSNMTLVDHLAEEGIVTYRTDVGDRYVLEKMKETGSRLGGEQSGHIIAFDVANTGDGMASAILFLTALSYLKEDLNTLVDRFNPYPQLLINKTVKDKNAVMASPILKQAEKEAAALLGQEGRMSLRPSGTESLVRIFVESRDAELMRHVASIMEGAIDSIVS